MKKRIQILQVTKIGFAFVVLGGALLVLASPFLSEQLFANVWGVEPLTYVGVVFFVLGLAGISASYAFVIVKLQNHAAKGITDKDFLLAKKIEDVVQWNPGADDTTLEGTPDDPRFKYIKYD